MDYDTVNVCAFCLKGYAQCCHREFVRWSPCVGRVDFVKKDTEIKVIELEWRLNRQLDQE